MPIQRIRRTQHSAANARSIEQDSAPPKVCNQLPPVFSPDWGAAQAAEYYSERSWLPLPLYTSGDKIRRGGSISEATGKEVRGTWKKIGNNKQALLNFQNKPDGNVGLLLGDLSGGLTDIDLDSEEALRLAPSFLPESGAISGRASSPRSHYWYITKGLTTTQYRDPLVEDKKQATLVELRSNNKNGGGAQTVAPPSVHHTGEQVQWDTPGVEPSLVDPSELQAAVAKLAAASLCVRYWGRGSRHLAALYMSGALARSGWSEEETSRFIEAIASTANDDEVADRLNAVRTSYEQFTTGEAVGGLNALVEKGVFDQRITSALAKWLQLGQDVCGAPGYGISGNLITFHPANVADNIQIISEVISQSAPRVFEFATGPVRVVKVDPARDSEGAHAVVTESEAAPTGSSVLERFGGSILRPLQVDSLRLDLTRDFTWQKPYANGNVRSAPPPRDDLKTFLSPDVDPSDRGLRPLKGMVAAPTLRPGTFEAITASGYDEASRLFIDYQPSANTEFTLPEPSKGNAEHAVNMFRGLLSEVAFVDSELGLSVWLTGLLGVLLKPCVGRSPMIVFDAPKKGSGKSYLVELIGCISAGHDPATITHGWDGDEFEKRLTSVAMYSDPMVVIDNVECELKSDFLCTMVTGDRIRVRPLGQSQVVDLPTNASVFVTGNNVSVYSDLVRRALTVRIDANVENPENRQFEFAPKDAILRNRDEYIGHADVAVVQNVDGQVASDPATIKDNLVKQLYRPVLWVDCVKYLVAENVTSVYECGPGKVLSGLNKRIERSLQGKALGGASELAAALAE